MAMPFPISWPARLATLRRALLGCTPRARQFVYGCGWRVPARPRPRALPRRRVPGAPGEMSLRDVDDHRWSSVVAGSFRSRRRPRRAGSPHSCPRGREGSGSPAPGPQHRRPRWCAAHHDRARARRFAVALLAACAGGGGADRREGRRRIRPHERERQLHQRGCNGQVAPRRSTATTAGPACVCGMRRRCCLR